MREIRFRAWSETYKKMSYFGLLDETFSETKEKDFGEKFHIMQYTELKDKIGKEIYEGDILSLPTMGTVSHIEIYNAIIKFNDGLYYLSYGKDEVAPLCNIRKLKNKNLDIKVIGNIYENPELLKE